MEGGCVEAHFCPVNAALTLLNGRWTPHIVHELLGGQSHFNEMARAIGVNPRTLRERLKELEDEGIVNRHVVTMMPPKVEYSLTEKGRALGDVFAAMAVWGRTWIENPKLALPCPSSAAELVDLSLEIPG